MRLATWICFISALGCRAQSGEAAPTAAAPAPAVAPATAAKPVAPAPTPAAVKAAATRTFSHQLEALDRRIAGAKQVTEKTKSSYIVLERVAGLYMERARLSGDYNDYRNAEEWLAKSFALNAHGNDFGPFQSRARLNYTLHRLDRVDADFDRAKAGALQDGKTRSGLLAFEANLALQRGEYEKARVGYESSIALDRNTSNLAALANYEWGTGDPDRADALYVEASSHYHGQATEAAAWIDLQRGLMDLAHGKYDDALVHYRAAETQIAGYWLIDEHVAEILTLTGKIEEAKALYLDIIERTNNPEFMDAMAGILFEEGKTDEAKAYVAQARKRYEELTAMYPEAAYGHALEHYLEFGEDTAFTVDLAERNHALRPNADAKVLLAQAYLKADRLKDAKAVIETALATPWRTADLHEVAAAVYVSLGEAAKGSEQLALAKGINPHVGT